jgi:hypothetical protein
MEQIVLIAIVVVVVVVVAVVAVVAGIYLVVVPKRLVFYLKPKAMVYVKEEEFVSEVEFVDAKLIESLLVCEADEVAYELESSMGQI